MGQIGIVSTRKSAYFEVSKLKDLLNIIAHFDKYPLQSAKSIDYLLWKQCILLMVTKEHLTRSGFAKILSIKVLFLVIVGLSLTFYLFFNISELSLISSFLVAHKYGVVDDVLILFVPIIIYSNAETDKSKIFSDNKGRAGVYQWKHIETGKIYVGSAFNLSERMYQYFSLSCLKKADNYISRALIHHTHSAFSLSILEYIDISNLSKEEARKLILTREQIYLDLIFSEDQRNTYNLLLVAGSLLGFQHSEESIAKMSGENNHLFGKTCSAETKVLMSEAKKGENHPLFGKTHSAETKAKMSKAKGGGTIYVYDSQGTLVNSFSSARNAADYFNCDHKTIMKYVNNEKIFQKQWILSTSLITKR